MDADGGSADADGENADQENADKIEKFFTGGK